MKTILIALITVSSFLSFGQASQMQAFNDSLELIWEGMPNFPAFDAVSPQQFNDSLTAIRQDIPATGGTGGAEVDPVWNAEKSGYAMLPIIIPEEADPVWIAQRGNYATLPITFPAESDPIWQIAAPNYATLTALNNGLAGKQATLVSGTNIKTINGQSILGSGDLVVTGGSGNGYTLQFFCLTSTLATAATYYIGAEPFAASTTQTLSKVICPKSGTVKRADIRFRRTNGTYTSGNFIMSVNVNNVATPIASVANFNTPQVFSNAALNIAVTAGNELQIKVQTPTLSVSGSACFISGVIYIE